MDAAQLGLFFVVVFGVIALPGLDMAFVLASSMRGGGSAGFAAVGGIVAGGAAHTLMGVLGVAAILAVWPPLFNAMLLAGAAYIGWIGWTLLRAQSASTLAIAPEAEQVRRGGAIFLRGMLTCLLNPKAYVFMLAVFPQFLRPEQGALWSQAALLGLIIAFTQALVYGAVTVGTLGARRHIRARPRGALIATRMVGAVLIGAGAWTLLQGWRAV